MLIDLHTHTCRYSPCSSFTPDSMVKAAIAAGLDGMVLTEHNHIWGEEETAELQAQYPEIKIFRGIEVASDSNDHFLVYGVLSPESFYPGMPTDKLLTIVEQEGGAVVLAHAYRYSDLVPDAIFHQPITALELCSSNIRRYAQPRIKALAEKLQVPTAAGSDGHAVETIGMFATDFPVEITDETGLVQALKAGKFQVHVNETKVANFNGKLEEKANWAKRLLDQGESPEEIHKRHGISVTLLSALQEGLDPRV